MAESEGATRPLMDCCGGSPGGRRGIGMHKNSAAALQSAGGRNAAALQTYTLKI